MLTYIRNIQYGTGKMNWYDGIESVMKEERIVDQFIAGCCRYITTQNTELLKETTHIFVEETIIGKKDTISVMSVFGTVYPFIKMIVFDDCNEINEQKNELLSLLKFFVKTGYCDAELVHDDQFVIDVMGLLHSHDLFVKSAILLEAIMERREKTIDIRLVPSFRETFRSISALHLGVFFPVLNYIVHSKYQQEVVATNCRFLVDCNVVQKTMHLFSLSTVHLAIIYLVQNESIDETDSLVDKFKMNTPNELESFPDVDLSFDGVQGLYCADLCSNMLFVLSCVFKTLQNEKEKEQLLNEVMGCEVMANLYISLNVEEFCFEAHHNTIHFALFHQFVHFVSVFPSSVLLGTTDGLELVEMIICDIEEDTLDDVVFTHLIGALESVLRSSSREEKETIGTERNLIRTLLHSLAKKQDDDPQHLVFDILGSLIRGSERNMECFFVSLPIPYKEFLKECTERCVETSVLVRSFILNIFHDHIHCPIDGIVEFLGAQSLLFLTHLLEALEQTGVTTHTTCCLNTIVLIIGLFSESHQHLLIETFSPNHQQTLKHILNSFSSKYSNDDQLNELCSITQTSPLVWRNGLSFLL